MTRRITFIVSAILAIALTSCLQQEEFSAVSTGYGETVSASLTLGMSSGSLITVTKAASDNDYSSLNSLLLIFFDSDGNYRTALGTADGGVTISSTSTTVTEGVQYTAEFEIASGTYSVVGIGNYTNVERWEGELTADGTTTMTFSEYLASILEDLENGTLTYNELLSKLIYISKEDYVDLNRLPSFNTGYMLLTGSAEITVPDTGGASGTIYMYRGVANIEFNVQSGSSNVTFTPSSYTVYNVPTGIILDSENEAVYSTESTSYYDTVENPIGTASSGVYTFSFFMPENIQTDVDYTATVTSTDGKTYSGYATREAWDYQTTNDGEKKDWLYAPDYATYVVIKGEYIETENGSTVHYSGDATYTIHLGNFSNGAYGNYTVKRNSSYIYTVTINGVDNVITEVTSDTDNSPGAEGSILNMESTSYNYVLDAHYEQVLVSFNLSDLASAVEDEATAENITTEAAIGNKLFLQIDTPFQSGIKQIQPYTLGSTGKTTALDGVDYKWVEFLPQANTYIAAYPGVASWNGGSSTSLLDAYDLCLSLGKAIKAIIDGDATLSSMTTSQTSSTSTTSGGGPNRTTTTVTTYSGSAEYEGITIVKEYTTTTVSSGGGGGPGGGNQGSTTTTTTDPEYHAYFTAFVNEYYYTTNPLTGGAIDWGDFADADTRRMIICMDPQTSVDGNSSYSTIHTSISQYSIQTFYDPAHASTLNGFGLETFNESGVCSDFGSDVSYTSSDTDGLMNFENIFNAENSTTLATTSSINWSTYLNTTTTTGSGWNQTTVESWPGWTSSVTATNGSDDREMPETLYEDGTSFGAWYACLSRNRDLDGDGKIDEDEVRWYLPAIEEYILISLGENALSNECRLYFGDKSAITDYPYSEREYGGLYYTSSSGSKMVFWAIEKAAYGAEGNYYTSNGDKSIPLRCARRLPTVLTDHDCEISPVTTIKQTTEGNYMADMSDYFETHIYRTSQIRYGALNPHNEDDTENKLYYGFVMPKYDSSFSSDTYNDEYGADYVGSGYYYKTLSEIAFYNEGDNPCGDYYEESDASDKGAWRLPNLSELTIITQNISYLNPGGYGAGDDKIACCTQFTNQNVRSGFGYHYSIMYCITGSQSSSFYTRCVRDATDDELANSTTVSSDTLGN